MYKQGSMRSLTQLDIEADPPDELGSSFLNRMEVTIMPTWRYRYRALFDELKLAVGERDAGIPCEILSIMARWNEQAVLEDVSAHTASRAGSACDSVPTVDMAAPSGMGTTGLSVRISPEGELVVDGVALEAPPTAAAQSTQATESLAVDGTAIAPGMAAEDIAALIVGEAGRDVTLRLQRRRSATVGR
eukprot:CAMPEP_0172156462 /NCGR_PEP_ID=MMETSP1050-20130122/3218_1 /TAXON_ID=233186 /ORGANISM="Cryptomonas curvata, Strain CCAP979/52" /LENGTH=188 /DNA_ID=CAMNT_0012825521 /DNA_START=79 /DNA_END=642 /DNA_ORIENTATION=-